MIFHLDYSEKACQDHATLVIYNNSLKAGSHGPIFGSNFRIQFLLQFKDVTDANQHFYELKECQRKNRIV